MLTMYIIYHIIYKTKDISNIERKEKHMIYPLNPVLMELLVLALICREDSYGYQISQQLKHVSSMKDSTLYPILRRLSEKGYVEIYDQQFQGRNRKYYRITETGRRQKIYLEQEWDAYTTAVAKILGSSHAGADHTRQKDVSEAIW